MPGFVDFQAQAVTAATVPGVAQVLHLLALGFEVEAAQVDPGFFAQLQRGQADVHVERQVLGAHLIEHRAGMVQVAQVAELPDHLGALLGRADRVVQGHQAAAATGVHEEGVVARVEQQRLVAGQGQAAIGLVGGQQNAVGTQQLLLVRQVNHRWCSAQQPGQGHGRQQQGAAHGGAQATRGIGIEGELPPQLMAVGHILVGEQQQPHRCADHTGAGHQKHRREW
ncbi:hypothetical protein D3C79_560810 [compost metagenome]